MASTYTPFVSFIEASGGVSKICELYPENANGVAQKIGHLLTYTSVSSMTICIKIFGGPLNVVYFMEKPLGAFIKC